MTEPVAQLIEYVSTHVPRYRRLGIRDIRQVPPSCKADIMKEMPEYISDEFGEARQRLFSLVRDGDPLFSHTAEGDDDMAAHIRTVLTAVNLSLPVHGGRLALGTWQGIYLWEHRTRPHSRRVALHFIGE